jgi:hypothetical protein
MKVAIQQPEHLPWMGFFDKMSKCDLFIYLDSVQFKKRYFENRNKIRGWDGWRWLGVPVLTKGRFTQKINEVEIDDSGNWDGKYLETLRRSYAKTPEFDALFPDIERVIRGQHGKLLDLNLALIDVLRRHMGIDTPTALASEIVPSKILKGGDLILKLCEEVDADSYISGPDGKNYLRLDDFENARIKLEYHDYNHPLYRQMHGDDFISHLSSVDFIFNRNTASISQIS